MSLRNDIKFVVSLICQSLGDIFRQLADYFSLPEDAPTPPREAPPPVRPRPSIRIRKQSISRKPPPEVLGSDSDVVMGVRPPKVRDRSRYNAKEHGQYKISALGILKVLLADESRRASAPEIAKELMNTKLESTESTIRSACKIMVSDGILDGVQDLKYFVYWIKDSAAARQYLAELEANAPTLPESSG
jgi:hypothetical protein